MNIRLLFLSFITILSFGCYEEPFYKLQVNVVNQSLEPIENAEVIISVQDEFGVIVDSANVYKSGFTNSNGNILFEFENLGFFTVESIKTFISIVDKYKKTGRSSLLLKIQRGEETSWVTIKFIDN